MLLDPNFPEQLDRVLKIFRQSTPVSLPTETVYGLAAPLNDEKAIAKVFSLKNRPTFHPLIVHVLDWMMAESYVDDCSELAKILIRAFWPGPLSLMLKRKKSKVPDLVTGGSDFVVLRCPKHPVFRNILSRWNSPLVAPSANRFSGISPTDCYSVLKELGPFGLEAVVDGGECALGLESTIVRIDSDTKISILRHGAVSAEQIKEILPDGVRVFSGVTDKNAPGSLEKHYSPAKKLYFIEAEEDLKKLTKSELKEMALLKVLEKDASWIDESLFKNRFILSTRNSDIEAASRFFRVIRRLDESKVYKAIVACATANKGLGVAINDRLLRASK